MKEQTYNQYLKSKGLGLVENGDFFKYEKKKQKYPVLEVHKSLGKMGWNKHLPHPLAPGEKVINLGTPPGTDKKYIMIRRGKRVDVFSKKDFIVPTKKKKGEKTK